MKQHWRCAITLIWVFPVPIGAQAGTLIGRVVRDSVAQPVAGAEVRLPNLGISTISNGLGEFHLDRIPAGVLIVAIRSPGSRPLEDTVVIRAFEVTDRQFRLSSLPVQLDSVRTVAKPVGYISPNLRGFRKRQEAGGGGYFVGDSVLRQGDDSRLPDILASRIPALTIVRDRSAAYFSSARNPSFSSGPIFSKQSSPKSPRDLQVSGCWVSVYIDGTVVYGGGAAGSMPPDAYALEARNYAGVEYYPGGASIPPEYNRTSNACGVLLLWTRER